MARRKKADPPTFRGSVRGDYRAIHAVILDSPEFVDMSPEAQLVFFHLKLRLGATGIDVLPAAEAMLSEATHYDLATIRRALTELGAEGDPPSHPKGIPHPMRMGWLRRERQVFWLRNALKFEPSRSLLNENHRKNIADHLAGLPKLKIVNDFADYYGLDRPFTDEWHPPSPSDGIPDHGRTEERSNGRTETESVTRASDDPERIFDGLDDVTAKSLKGLYGWNGAEGTDERVWNGTAAPDRVRCLSIAIDRLRGEGKPYNGKFFRAILVSVIQEQASRPTSGRPSGALKRPSVFDLPEAQGA